MTVAAIAFTAKMLIHTPGTPISKITASNQMKTGGARIKRPAATAAIARGRPAACSKEPLMWMTM